MTLGQAIASNADFEGLEFILNGCDTDVDTDA